MKVIKSSQIRDAVSRLWGEANFELPGDIIDALRKASRTETSPAAREVIARIVENASIAARDRIPICQDTGVPIVFVRIGRDIRIEGNMVQAIARGVRQATKQEFLRASMVNDPIERVNTGDNTPPVIHVDSEPGSKLRILVAAKGAGSENMSAVKMLKPTEGEKEIMAFVLETVKAAGAKSCPPLVVGVGIGGTFEKAAMMAKLACLRPLNRDKSTGTTRFEQKLFGEINNLGIGPAGFGGKTTALAVNVERYGCHIASLPVAVALNCHAVRRKETVLQ